MCTHTYVYIILHIHISTLAIAREVHPPNLLSIASVSGVPGISMADAVLLTARAEQDWLLPAELWSLTKKSMATWG